MDVMLTYGREKPIGLSVLNTGLIWEVLAPPVFPFESFDVDALAPFVGAGRCPTVPGEYRLRVDLTASTS